MRDISELSDDWKVRFIALDYRYLTRQEKRMRIAAVIALHPHLSPAATRIFAIGPSEARAAGIGEYDPNLAFWLEFETEKIAARRARRKADEARTRCAASYH